VYRYGPSWLPGPICNSFEPAAAGDPARAQLLARPARSASSSRARSISRRRSTGSVVHGGQPLLDHVIAAAQTLAELNLGADTLCAALLRRAYETSTSLAADIKERFGAAVGRAL
jgi:(p)ppGpp synthase/HD superfamily hydrolase